MVMSVCRMVQHLGPDLDFCSQLLDEVSKTFDQTFMDEAL